MLVANGKAHNRNCLAESGVIATNAGSSTAFEVQSSRPKLAEIKHLSRRLSAPAGPTSQGRMDEWEEQFTIAHFLEELSALVTIRAPRPSPERPDSRSRFRICNFDSICNSDSRISGVPCKHAGHDSPALQWAAFAV